MEDSFFKTNEVISKSVLKSDIKINNLLNWKSFAMFEEKWKIKFG